MDLIRLNETVNVSLSQKAKEAKDKVLNVLESNRHVVVPKIEAIHTKVTRNFTFYPQSKLRGNANFTAEDGRVRPTGVHSWTKPYYKPMLKNHDIFEDPLGRITKAEYKAKTSIGLPGIICYPEITDPYAIEKVLDGRFSTVSIGADTDAAICSICGQNQLEEWCGHRRGQTYEGKLCFWQVGNIWFIELSYVNSPSDEDANTVEVPEVETRESVQLGLLLQDLKENKLYDLNNDTVYVIKDDKLVQIPQTEFIKEYYYIPFNTIEEKEPQGIVQTGEASNIITIEGASNKKQDGKQANRVKTGTRRQALYGHNLLHALWGQESNTNWTKEQIKEEHNRVVKTIVDKGWGHKITDSLDDALPSSLKEKSNKKD